MGRSLEEVEEKISHHVERLNALENNEANKRIRKRIMQELGKLKKEKASLEAAKLDGNEMIKSGNSLTSFKLNSFDIL